jgi:hypothetical protein
MFFNGLPETNIRNINVENAFITLRLGTELSELENIKLKNVTVIPSEGVALILNNARNVKFDIFFAPEMLETVVKITGNHNNNIELPENIDKKRIIHENN